MGKNNFSRIYPTHSFTVKDSFSSRHTSGDVAGEHDIIEQVPDKYITLTMEKDSVEVGQPAAFTIQSSHAYEGHALKVKSCILRR